MIRWSCAGRLVLLLLIVAVAALVRFTDINWDRFQHVHPDERWIVMVADTMAWPGDLATALDPAMSTLNPLRYPPAPGNPSDPLAGQPRNYAYGHFPLYLLVAAAHLAQAVGAWLGETTLAFPAWMQPLHTVGRQMASYNYLPLVGRALSALADLGTLVLVYGLTRRLVDHAERVSSQETITAYEDAAEHPERRAAARSRRMRSDLLARPHPSTAPGPLPQLRSGCLLTVVEPDEAGEIDFRTYLPLLAAAAYAFAVLPIQLSHFATVDAILTFCVTATLALAVRRAEGGGWRAWLLAGVMAGLAVGSKFSAVLLAAPLLVASFYRLPDGARGPATQAKHYLSEVEGDAARLHSPLRILRLRRGPYPGSAQDAPLLSAPSSRRTRLRKRRAAVVAGRMAAVAGAALVAFAITNPFALIEARAYAMQIFTQNAMVSGAMDAPYTRQYIGTLPYLYFVQQLSQWGLGWPLGLAAWGGLVWAIVRALRWRGAAPGPALVILLAWAVPYFATTGAFHAKFLRYMAPLLPCLLAFAAGGAAVGWRWLSHRFGRWGRAAWVTAAGATLAVTIAWAAAFTGVYRQEHPWVAASRWIYANIPAGAKVLTEHWDDALPLALDELPDRPAKRSYQGVELPLWEPDTTAKLDTLVAELSTADYIVIASNRLYAPMQRLRSRYPMASQYYRMLFAGDLGYRQVAEFTAYPTLFGVTIRDDHADESFTVYDHPRVLVFENAGRYKPELLRARLGRYLPAAASSAASDENVAEHLAQAPQTGNLDQAPQAEHFGQAPQAEPLDQPSQAEHPERSRGRGPGVVEGCEAATAQGRILRLRPAYRGGTPLRMLPKLCSGQDAYLRVHSRSSASYSQISSRPPTPGRTPGLARLRPQAAAPGSALLDQPVDTLPVVADFRWNRVASDAAPLAALLWWLAVSLFGWAAWPLLFPLLRGLADRGYGLARAAGWLLVGWVHWLGVSLGWWENRLPPIALILGAFVLAGLIAWRVQRRQLAVFWSRRRRLILGIELLFGLAYLAFVGVRLLNPDLWQPWNGGEKFMESAFLNAILRSAHFPPYDPYFAGGVINYYYYGFYLVSLPIKLTGIAPEVAFNLAVPALFAMTAVGAFSVAYSLAEGPSRNASDDHFEPVEAENSDVAGIEASAGLPQGAQVPNDRLKPLFQTPCASTFGIPAGDAGSAPVQGRTLRRTQGARPISDSRARPALTALLSAGMTVLMGNLKGLDWFGKALSSLVRGEALPRYDYWAASRVIPYTINEFPLWTFTFADLHPHLIAMPFGLLVVGLALNWAGGRGQGPGGRRQASGVRGQALLSSLSPCHLVTLSPCLLLSLSLGALGAINTWDVPTYGLLVAGAVVLAAWRRSFPSGVEAVRKPPSGLAGFSHQVADRLKPRFHRELATPAPDAPVPGEAQVSDAADQPAEADFAMVAAVSTAGSPDQPTDQPTPVGFAMVAAISIARSLGSLLLIAALSIVAYLPFHAHYDPPFGGEAGPLLARYLGWVRAASPLGDWLTVWGAWVALVFSYLAVVWWGVRRRPARAAADAEGEAPAARRDGWVLALLGLIGLLAVLAASGRPTAALALPPFCLFLPLIFRRAAPVTEGFVALLVALALAVIAGTELVYLRDFLSGGEWYRMNTLFKFSVPAWLLLGVAGGPMLRQVWLGLRRAPASLAAPWQAALIALLAGSLTFLAVGVRTRVDDRFPGRWPPFGTLDGTAYMTVGRYAWPDASHVIDLAYERAAIRWLWDNVRGTPVIAEAPAGWYEVGSGFQGYDYYRAGGLRVASLTGLPTFLGAHQGEQRSGEQVGQRSLQGQAFFSTTDLAQARVLLRDLRVGYVYIGQLERVLFAPEALRKFDVLVELGELEVAYRNPEVTIYRVLR